MHHFTVFRVENLGSHSELQKNSLFTIFGSCYFFRLWSPHFWLSFFFCFFSLRTSLNFSLFWNWFKKFCQRVFDSRIAEILCPWCPLRFISVWFWVMFSFIYFFGTFLMVVVRSSLSCIYGSTLDFSIFFFWWNQLIIVRNPFLG